MLKKIKSIFRKKLPYSVWQTCHSFMQIVRNFKLRIKMNITRNWQRKALSKIRKKDRLKVVFLLIESSNWKYDSVYKAMEMDERFEPIVVICPLKSGLFDQFQIQEKLELGVFFCKSKNYKFVNSWLGSEKSWLDVKSVLRPDIVFFSNPHQITLPIYCIDNFYDMLTCYVPYSVRNDHLVELAFNERFEQLTWLNFYETDIHREIATQVALNKGKNVVVVGYPTFDELLEKSKNPKIPSSKKTIIWAPHWTIGKDQILNRSCFFEFCDFFIELAGTYLNEIDVILRPHPFLRATLEKEEWWGKKKTEDYFRLWNEKPNLSINVDDYTDVFAVSDLLVHDSVSFLTEYLVTGKPSIFTKRKVQIDPPSNKFGKICLDAHYIVDNRVDLDQLIHSILFKGKDDKYAVRQDFISNYVEPNLNSAEKIVTIIKNKILANQK